MRRKVGMLVGTAAAAVLGFGALSCGGTNDLVPAVYTATLTGAKEVPPKTSAGTATATFTDLGTEIDWTLSFDGLTNVVASHIHGPADAATNASVIFPLYIPAAATGTARPITAGGVINNTTNPAVSLDALRAMFNNGTAYVNIHTTVNQGGEIRGQVARSN